MRFTQALEAVRKRRSLRRDKGGAALVEFAMIAFPFFIMIFGLVEIMMIFVISTTLEYGVSEAARRVRTGELQNANGDLTAFKTSVCGNLYNLMDCGSKLTLDVRKFDSFASSSMSDPLNPDGTLKTSSFGFVPGGPNDIVIVRAFYEWDLITPVLSAPMANMGPNSRLLIATATFRNEPF